MSGEQSVIDESFWQQRTDEELAADTPNSTLAFGELMRRYESRLLAYIRRISNVSQEDAQDILQETFLKAYTNIRSFDSGLKFSSWMYRITRNQVISSYRKRQARPEGHSYDISDDALHSISSDFDVAGDVDSRLLKEQFADVLSQIDIKYRDVLVLKFLEEKSYDEIADILKIPPGTVATRINRAKKHCKPLLQPH